jgi:hypothetical protein
MKNTGSAALPEAMAQSVQLQLKEKYPDLTVSANGSQICIRGSFPLIHEAKVLDRYQIEIEWVESNREAPVLWETAGRIPRTEDRHIDSEGKACPLVPEEWLIRAPEARTLIHYLDGPVRDYFLWQSLTERGITPPQGQRSHHVAGLIESYGDMVGVKGKKAVTTCLDYLSKKKVKGHWPCYCGSGLPLRNCHVEHLRSLQGKIPRHIAELALKRLATPTMR